MLYVLPEVSPKELMYLQLLEGAHHEDVEDIADDGIERREAYYCVSYMIGRLSASYLERMEDALTGNWKQILAAGRKWEEYRVATFAEVNSTHGGIIAGVFCINHTAV